MMTKILLILVACLALVSPIFAVDSGEMGARFDGFITKIETKYPDLDRQISFYGALQKKLKSMRATKQKPEVMLAISQIQSLNDAHLKDLKLKSLAKAFPQVVVDNPDFQKLTNIYMPLAVNENFEFFKGNEKNRIKFEKYYPVNSLNITWLIKKPVPNGILVIFEDHSLAVVEDYTYEKKYSFEDLKKIFTKNYDTKNPYFIQDHKLIGYKYKEYKSFDESEGIYLSELKENGIDPNTALLVMDGKKYLFVQSYEIISIANESSLTGVSNRDEFIKQILDDRDTFATSDTDQILSDLRGVTLNITKNAKSNDEKIAIIYDWIIDNITYNSDFQNQGEAPFSWLETFKNRLGVCDGYTKIFFYMLSYANIPDVEIKQWMAYADATFPKFWHAWVKVGNDYYDPTFDDPIWWDKYSPKHLYFKIPKSLMYTDRFDGTDIPESIKSLTVDQRIALVLKNKYDLYNQFPNYGLMWDVRLRKSIGISYDELLTIETLKKHMTPYHVSGYQFTDKDGYTRKIKAIQFYIIDDTNLNSIFQSLWATNSTILFLEWEKPDKSLDYRIVKEIEYY